MTRTTTASVAVLLALCGAGCGTTASKAPALPSKVTSISLKSGKFERVYGLYVPPGDSSQHRLPLVLVYHGAGDNAGDAATETDLLSIDRRKRNLILAFPQGYDGTWNEGAGHTPAEQAGVNDVAFTAAMIRGIESRHAVDMRHVVATGISNGALLTELFGCRLAGSLTLIAPVEGELPASVSPGCHPSQPIAVYEVHGTADHAIPYAGGHFSGAGGGTTVLSAPSSARRWATLDHCSPHPRTTRSGKVTDTTYSGCGDGVSVTLATIQGGAHQWPDSFGQTLISVMAASAGTRQAVTPS